MIKSAHRLALTGVIAVASLTGAMAAPAQAESPANAVTCASAQLTVKKGQQSTYQIECSTLDGSAIDSYTLVTGPAHAQTFNLNPQTGAVTYVPATGYSGTDSFTFRATAGTSVSPNTTVTWSVENTAPTCNPVADQTVVHDRLLTITPECSDADGDAVTTREGNVAPSHGNLTATGATLTYQPNTGFVGTDTFTYRVSDGSAGSTEQQVKVTVTNHAPVCSPLTIKAIHDRTTTFRYTCADPDGDSLQSSVVAIPQHGYAALGQTGTGTYRPVSKFLGADTFTFVANDGIASSSITRANVAVTNALPLLAVPSRISASLPVSFRVTASDADRDAVSVRLYAAPKHGRVAINGTVITYTPAIGYTGADSFSLRPFDGLSWGAARTVAVADTAARPQILGAHVDRTGATAKIGCRQFARSCAGTGTVVVKVGTKYINGTAKFLVAKGGTGSMWVSFSSTERRILAASKATSLPVRVVLYTRDAAGKSVAVSKSLTALRTR